MSRTINKLPNAHVEVICPVDTKTWKEAQEAAFKKLAANVQIPGFRKGKAPENMVRSKVNPGQVFDEAINAVLPKLYKAIVEEDKIEPYAQPKVDVTKLSDTELEVKFTITVAPEVKLGKYTGLEIGKTEVSVTDEELEADIKRLLDQNGTLIVKEGKSEKGDTVVIDFKGSVDGKEFEGGSSENYELVLGSNSFIPGFEDQLIGHEAGEHVDVNVKFPEQYTEELKGKDALFACDIHEVKTRKPATLPVRLYDTCKKVGYVISWSNLPFSMISCFRRLLSSQWMSAACPTKCCEFFTPPTSLLCFSHRYPLFTSMGIPNFSRTGSSTSRTKAFTFSLAKGGSCPQHLQANSFSLNHFISLNS